MLSDEESETLLKRGSLLGSLRYNLVTIFLRHLKDTTNRLSSFIRQRTSSTSTRAFFLVSPPTTPALLTTFSIIEINLKIENVCKPSAGIF